MSFRNLPDADLSKELVLLIRYSIPLRTSCMTRLLDGVVRTAQNLFEKHRLFREALYTEQQFFRLSFIVTPK